MASDRKPFPGSRHERPLEFETRKGNPPDLKTKVDVDKVDVKGFPIEGSLHFGGGSSGRSKFWGAVLAKFSGLFCWDSQRKHSAVPKRGRSKHGRTEQHTNERN